MATRRLLLIAWPGSDLRLQPAARTTADCNWSSKLPVASDKNGLTPV
jgi:hypothetical protein